MEIAGRLGADAPDPGLRMVEQLRQMPISMFGLVPQPSLEDWGALGSESSTRDGVIERITAAIGYTLWRNPDDHGDPVNLVDLDAETKAALETEPPWPRPRWLIERLERSRYRMLWEVVRTTWCREGVERSSIETELINHLRHILMNRFQVGRSSRGKRLDLAAFGLDEQAMERNVSVTVDDHEVPGIRFDTDSRVFGIGVDLGDRGQLTAVIERDALPYIRLAFAERPV